MTVRRWMWIFVAIGVGCLGLTLAAFSANGASINTWLSAGKTVPMALSLQTILGYVLAPVAWLIGTLAVAAGSSWPLVAIAPVTLRAQRISQMLGMEMEPTEVERLRAEVGKYIVEGDLRRRGPLVTGHADRVALLPANIVQVADGLDVPVEAEVGDDAARRRLRFRRRDGDADAGSVQLGEQVGHAGVEVVVEQAPGVVILAVGADDARYLLGRDTDAFEGDLERRADERVEHVLLGHRDVVGAQRMPHRCCDAARRVGQRPVEIEQHESERAVRPGGVGVSLV